MTMLTKYSPSSLASLLLFASLTNAAPAALLAHYSFDSDYSDSSPITGGGTATAIEAGGATVGITTTGGEFVFGGGAASFSSTEANEAYLDISQTISFAAGDAWSVSFWVRRTSGSTNRQGMVVGDRTNEEDFLWASDNSSQVQGMRFRSTADTNANFGGFPDDGNFHHWVVISDGAGSISAFRDNVAQLGVASNESFNITTIGQAYSNSFFSMNGQIDELYVFDEAIDSETVGNLFSTNTIPEPSAISLLAIGGLLSCRRRRA